MVGRNSYASHKVCPTHESQRYFDPDGANLLPDLSRAGIPSVAWMDNGMYFPPIDIRCHLLAGS